MSDKYNPSKGIRDILVEAGVGSAIPTDDWSFHIGRMPKKPVNAIGIYDSGNRANPRWLLDTAAVQVRVRGEAGEYVAAREKCTEVVDALLGYPSHDRDNSRWVMILLNNGPTYIGVGDNDQPEFTINFNLTIEPPSSPASYREPL